MQKDSLNWPPGWRRTPIERRLNGRFKEDGQALSIHEAIKRTIRVLRLFGVKESDIIVSCNVPLRRDGLPLSRSVHVSDPGVCVYWTRKGKPESMPVDHYHRVADNLAAIAAILDAMRLIQRHGGSTILERAFTGFTALPAPNTWRAVMGLPESAPCNIATVKSLYRSMSKSLHPDNGGSESKMAELNWAMTEAQKEACDNQDDI